MKGLISAGYLWKRKVKRGDALTDSGCNFKFIINWKYVAEEINK